MTKTKNIIDPRSLGESVDGFDERITHSMSGYNGEYDICKFEGEVIKKSNGKFVVVLDKKVYHGDLEDEGCYPKSDIIEHEQTISDEFDTEEAASDFMMEIECEYDGIYEFD